MILLAHVNKSFLENVRFIRKKKTSRKQEQQVGRHGDMKIPAVFGENELINLIGASVCFRAYGRCS